jgi:hypothetical protein
LALAFALLLGQTLRLALLSEIECGARRFAAAQEIWVSDAAGVGTVKFGQEGAARIRGDRRNRAKPWPETKTVQREGSLSFRIASHRSLHSRQTLFSGFFNNRVVDQPT